MRNPLKKFTLGAVMALALGFATTALAQTGNSLHQKAEGDVTFTPAGQYDEAHVVFDAMAAREQNRGKSNKAAHEKGPTGSGSVLKEDTDGPNPDIEYFGKVDCYSQDGNIAKFSGQRFNDPDFTDPQTDGTGRFHVAARDNGPDGGDPDPDRIIVNDDSPLNPGDCGNAQDPGGRAVDTGDIVVHAGRDHPGQN